MVEMCGREKERIAEKHRQPPGSNLLDTVRPEYQQEVGKPRSGQTGRSSARSCGINMG